MALVDCERCVSRSLRKMLADVPIGASICNLEVPEPEHTQAFFHCLEFFLPDVLGEVHFVWRKESFDDFFPLFARKMGPTEAELFGQCIVISDQANTPFHLRIQISLDSDEVSWLEFRVGEKGDGGKLLKSIASYKSNECLIQSTLCFSGTTTADGLGLRNHVWESRSLTNVNTFDRRSAIQGDATRSVREKAGMSPVRDDRE